jgi:signal transduction histidine kinase
MRESLDRARAGERSTYPLKMISSCRDELLFLVSTTPMFDKKGVYMGVIELCSDMSTQLKIEDELREAKAEADLYIDVMSHDINNMQQVALGYLEMAKNELNSQGKIERSNGTFIDKPIEVLKDSTQLITNIKTLQKERLGRIPAQTIDMGNLLSEVKELFSKVPNRNITINLVTCSNCLVKANYLLKEVFINLIGNAIKHSTGSLTIDIKLKKVVEEEKGYYLITIEDTGPGIPDTKKKEIFQKFTPSEIYSSGRGLGLYLINTLIEDFKGHVRIEDRVPEDYTKGSRFVILLPTVE